MAAGRPLNPARAHAMGLVDRLAPLDRLEKAARELVTQLASRFPGRRPPRSGRARLLDGLVCWLPPLRWLIFSRIRKKVAAQAGPHYPAPLAIVEAVAASCWLRRKNGFRRERELFARLVLGDVCRHLVGLFFLHRESRKWYLPAEERAHAQEIQTVAVLGAGVMGAGIALQAASKGLEVILRDISDAALDTAVGRIRSRLKERVEKHRLSREDMEALLRRIQPVTDLGPLAGADLVIEAVVEEMGLKQRVLLEASKAAPKALLATNTSALSVAEMASPLSDPGRLAGLHFFNPVEKMPLVEIILPERASAGLLAPLARFIHHLGKSAVKVKDSPGFLVNRVLSVYLGEAVQMVVEGFSIRSVDGLMRRFGMPVGPLELLDQVGLDVAGKVVQTLRSAFPHRLPPVDLLARMMEKGRTGQKSGAGFYRHGAGMVPDQEGVVRLAGLKVSRFREAKKEDLSRLVHPMLGESARCLADHVVGRPAEIDLAMVMGIGWPPFSGGPLRHADEMGLDVLVASLEALARRHGERFRPPPLMVEMVREGRRFHS
ncbi:MAG: 3-hydroxyacyl-CoA dehydrogenase NAD-binding domain-containing protein [Acidobacteriota bacterium]